MSSVNFREKRERESWIYNTQLKVPSNLMDATDDDTVHFLLDLCA